MNTFIAKPCDVIRTIDLAKTFIEDANLKGGFDPEHYKVEWENLIESGIGKMILVEREDGKIVAGITALIIKGINSGVSTCVETSWFSSPELSEFARGLISVRLMHALERLAVSSGAKIMAMGLINGYRDKSIRSLYEKFGFEKSEETWIKEIR